MKRKNDLREWQAVNKVTGEVVDLDVLQILDGEHWEKVFVSQLAEMIGIGLTGGGAQVLSYLLKNKNKANEVHGTQREIADALNVSVPTVNKIIKRLESHSFIKQIRSGFYLFNPACIYFGNPGNQHAILKIWRMEE